MPEKRNKCRDETHLGMSEAQYGAEEAIMVRWLTPLSSDADLNAR